MKTKIYIAFLLFSNFISAQKTPVFNSIETVFFIGKNIEHDKSLHNAIQGNAYGFMLFTNTKNNEKSRFNTLYNYPEKGFSFIYLNYNSTILGEAIGGYRHYSYNLTPKSKKSLKLTTGFGLGIANSPYNENTNNQNFALGSNLLVTAFLKLNYFQHLFNKHLAFTSGISLVHFSNVAFKNPNLGINTVSLHLGLKYQNQTTSKKHQKARLSVSNEFNKWNYNLIFRTGYNESLVIGSGLFPFYTVSFYGSKFINNYSIITAGIDYFDSKFLKNYIQNKAVENNKNYNKNDYKRVGLFIGHELSQNHFAFVSQIGYTIYYPFPYVSRIYERFGFNYKLSKHFISEITLKVNLFRAEGLEFGFGYTF